MIVLFHLATNDLVDSSVVGLFVLCSWITNSFGKFIYQYSFLVHGKYIVLFLLNGFCVSLPLSERYRDPT